MHKTRDQHFVPVVYLKQWALSCKKGVSSRDKKLWALDVKNMSITKKPLYSICTEEFFYDLGPNDVNQIWENFFSNQIESEIEGLYRHIIAQESIKDLRKDKKKRALFATFFASQLLRSPALRSNFHGAFRGLDERLSEMAEAMKNIPPEKRKAATLPPSSGKQFKLEDIKRLASEDGAKSMHLDTMADMKKWAMFFGEHKKWILFRNITNIPFFTSDTPATSWSKQHGIYGGAGMLSLEREYFMPISKKLAIVLPAKSEDLVECPSFGTYEVKDNKIIEKMNLSIAEASGRYVFSNLKPELRNLRSKLEKQKANH